MGRPTLPRPLLEAVEDALTKSPIVGRAIFEAEPPRSVAAAAEARGDLSVIEKLFISIKVLSIGSTG